MEIERKYLIKEDKVPDNYKEYNFYEIEQAYLCIAPVVRIRKQNDDYVLTYKSKGHMIREEHNLPLTKESYEHLLNKADGTIITKRRYLIPFNKYMIELDIFSGKHEGLILAEVEFETQNDAENFTAPEWFGEDVTFSGKYHNSMLSQ